MSRWPEKIRRIGLMMAISAAMIGCTSPPAVTPLLRVTASVLEDQSRLIEDDIARVASMARQSRAALDDAFAADLGTVAVIERQWVLEAAQVYAAASAALALHEAEARAMYRQRQENLRLAAMAQQRAIALIEQQDRLITHHMGIDLWRLWQQPINP